MASNVIQATAPTLQNARFLASCGFAVFPVRLDGTKAPCIADWQIGSMPTDLQLSGWFGFDQAGIGIRCGTASSNLVVIDFDEDAGTTFPQWWALIQQLVEFQQIANAICVVQTPRTNSGYHVYIRSTNAVDGSRKLAAAVDPADPSKAINLIETRGQGGYVVGVGSPLNVHENGILGQTYQVVHGNLGQVTALPHELVIKLIDLAKSLNRLSRPVCESAAIRQGVDAGLEPYHGPPRAGDWFNRYSSIRDLLQKHGWTLSHTANTGVEHWTRPGKSSGTSATLGYCRTGSGLEKLYVFSSNAAPLRESRTYDAFALLAHLEHNGDFDAAAQAVATLNGSAIGAEQFEWFRDQGKRQWSVIAPKKRWTKPEEAKLTEKLRTAVATGKQADKVGVLAWAIVNGMSADTLLQKSGSLFSGLPELQGLLDQALASVGRQSYLATQPRTEIDGRQVFDLGSVFDSGAVLDVLTGLAVDSGLFYQRDDLVVSPTNRVIDNPEIASNHFASFVTMTENGKKSTLPKQYYSDWIHVVKQQNVLPKVTYYTKCPVIGLDGAISPPGLDSATGVYYSGNPILPDFGTFVLDELLAEFAFASDRDRHNFIGYLLTMVLMPSLPKGGIPMLALIGNQPGIGKSTLANIVMTLRGEECDSIDIDSNDSEVEKRICSAVRAGATTINFDNARSGGEIANKVLERNITADVCSFRILGKSELFRVANRLMFILSANTPTIGTDLLSRSLVVNLEVSGDPLVKQYKLADPLQFAKQHREQILGELLGLVKMWVLAGSPETPPNSRFPVWSKIVGGVLRVAGATQFDPSPQKELSQEELDFQELVTAMNTAQPGHVWKASEIAGLCISNGLFQDRFKPGASDRSNSVTFGKLASSLLGRRYSGFEFYGHYDLSAETRVYRLLLT